MLASKIFTTMDPLNRLNYFVLKFKTENGQHTEGIYALNLSHAKDRLMLFYPEATDIHHVTEDPILNTMAALKSTMAGNTGAYVY